MSAPSDTPPRSDSRTARGGRIILNFGFLTGGKILGDAATFVFIVVVSRKFGQEGIGVYSTAMAWTGFLIVLAEFGLYNLSIKEMSRASERLGEYIGEILTLRLLLGGIVYLAFVGLLAIVPASAEMKQVFVILGAYQILNSTSVGLYGVSVSREEMHIAGALEFLLKLAIALAALTVLALGGTLVMALSVYPVLSAVQLIVAYVLVTRRYARPRLSLHWPSMARTLREAVPYGVFRILLMVSMRTDVAMLSVLLGIAAAGVYNVAYRVIFLLLFVPYYASLALFPVASRLFTTNREELDRLYHRSLGLMVLLGLPAAAGLWLIAPGLVDLVFGAEFAESASVMRILAWLLLVYGVKSVMGAFLTACDRQGQRTRGQWIGATINLAANFTLISLIGIRGAAIATLFSEVVLTGFFALRLQDLFGFPRVRSRLVVAVLATAAFSLPLYLGPDLPLVMMIPIAVVVYLAILAAFPGIRATEGRFLLELLAESRKTRTAAGQRR